VDILSLDTLFEPFSCCKAESLTNTSNYHPLFQFSLLFQLDIRMVEVYTNVISCAGVSITPHPPIIAFSSKCQFPIWIVHALSLEDCKGFVKGVNFPKANPSRQYTVTGASFETYITFSRTKYTKRLWYWKGLAGNIGLYISCRYIQTASGTVRITVSVSAYSACARL
jgi:hypothetical protein